MSRESWVVNVADGKGIMAGASRWMCSVFRGQWAVSVGGRFHTGDCRESWAVNVADGEGVMVGARRWVCYIGREPRIEGRRVGLWSDSMGMHVSPPFRDKRWLLRVSWAVSWAWDWNVIVLPVLSDGSDGSDTSDKSDRSDRILSTVERLLENAYERLRACMQPGWAALPE